MAHLCKFIRNFMVKIRRLCLKDRLLLEELLKEGKSMTECAHVLDKSISSLYDEVLRCGGRKYYNAVQAHEDNISKQLKRHAHGLSEIQGQKIKVFLDEGLSLRDIGRKMGVSRQKITTWATHMGLKINDPTVDMYYKSYEDRLDALEMQMKIVIEQLRTR